MSKASFLCFSCANFLTVVDIATYSVTKWEKVGLNGFLHLAFCGSNVGLIVEVGGFVSGCQHTQSGYEGAHGYANALPPAPV